MLAVLSVHELHLTPIDRSVPGSDGSRRFCRPRSLAPEVAERRPAAGAHPSTSTAVPARPRPDHVDTVVGVAWLPSRVVPLGLTAAVLPWAPRWWATATRLPAIAVAGLVGALTSGDAAPPGLLTRRRRG